MTDPLSFLVRLRRLPRIGTLVAATIAAAGIADLVLRALPPDRYSFRVWEAMRTRWEPSPFRHGARYHRDDVYGNLAALGNLPEHRDYRAQTFTTDELGYHNAPDLLRAGAPAAVLFGTSQSAGAEVNDGETLSAQLTAHTQRLVYNAAAGDLGLGQMRALARRLGVERGLIILEPPETADLPPITTVPPGQAVGPCPAVLRALDRSATCRRLGRLAMDVRVSPLQIFAQRALKAIQNDRLLPNPYAGLVLRARLRNGADMLFLPEERVRFHEARSEEPLVRYLSWLDRKLRADGLRLLVVLVPKKFTVYAPLLQPPEAGVDRAAAYHARVERRLRGAGIPVVNLTEPFRAAAAAGVDAGEYIYWRDDTHWNAAGIAIAAAEIARAWDRD